MNETEVPRPKRKEDKGKRLFKIRDLGDDVSEQKKGD